MTNRNEKVTDITRETYTIYDEKERQYIKVRFVFGSYEETGRLRVRLYRQTPESHSEAFSTLYKELTIDVEESQYTDVDCQFIGDFDDYELRDWFRSNQIGDITGMVEVSEEYGLIEAYMFNIPPNVYRRICLERMSRTGLTMDLRLRYPMRFRSLNNPGYPIKDMRTFLRKKLNSILKARYPRTLLNIHKTLWNSGYIHPLLECYNRGRFQAEDISVLTLDRVCLSLRLGEMYTVKEATAKSADFGKIAVEEYRQILEMAVRELIQQIDDNGIDRAAISDFIENQNDLIRDITFNKKRLKTMTIFRFKYRKNGQPGSARMIVLEERNGQYTPVVPITWENPEWKGTVKDTWRALADPGRVFHIEQDKDSGSLQVTECENRKK